MGIKDKNCEKCVHNNICNIKDNYCKLKSSIEGLKSSYDINMDDFDCNIFCKHFFDYENIRRGI